ncbi:proline-rich receptor-like protein kinase PERK8 [Iris pallida]|uniref:Proline-rich receptor-like protein kinase PERK8 n=1 Tax=Iris pallida TaxID=29817 RepID=A0AAX6DGY6_IRIPA|nr:proline-rich receptor-like protein kinase PERK8 [Iris pallida]
MPFRLVSFKITETLHYLLHQIHSLYSLSLSLQTSVRRPVRRLPPNSGRASTTSPPRQFSSSS